ncbi:MAG: hypothetical protein M3Y07_12005 [Acidobacteriota bacterium]|nr:hypothetical protein [Acidobacteriota bacterium]
MNRILFFCTPAFACLSLFAAEDPSAVIILKTAAASGGKCATGGDLQFIKLQKIKINGKSDIHVAVAAVTATEPSSPLDSRIYSKAKGVALRSLDRLVFAKNGLLYAYTAGETPSLAIPAGLKIERNVQVTFSSTYGVNVEGEMGDGKGKSKKTVPLRNIWKIYPMSASDTPEEALFRHAQEENTVDLWQLYLAKVSSYKVDEANRQASGVVTACIDEELAKFNGGQFEAIDKAERLAKRLVGASAGSSEAAAKLKSVTDAKTQAVETISQGEQLKEAGKWDQALTTWQPAIKYSGNAAAPGNFKAAYEETLQKSHDQHLALAEGIATGKGKDSRGLTLSKPGPREALKEYETALTRQPKSKPAQAGKTEMTIRVALDDQQTLLRQKKPEEAYKLLSKVSGVYKNEPRLMEALHGASCQYSDELFANANIAIPEMSAAKPAPRASSTRKGAGARKTVSHETAAEKALTINGDTDRKKFKDARLKLMESIDLCASPDKQAALVRVNQTLSDNQAALANRAQRKYPATALLHATASQVYVPERADIQPLIDAAKEQVRKKTRLQVGVVVRNSSGSPQCGNVAQSLAGDLEAGLAKANISGAQVIDRDKAQQILQSRRSGERGGPENVYAILIADIQSCSIQPTRQASTVASRYLEKNGNYDSIKQAETTAQIELNQCHKANPNDQHAACVNYKNRLDLVRGQLQNQPEFLARDYSYGRVDQGVKGMLRVNRQIEDGISKAARSAGETRAEVNESCTGFNGVRADDEMYGNGSSGGSFLSALTSSANRNTSGPVQNKDCPGFNPREGMVALAAQAGSELQTRAAVVLAAVPNGYLEAARRATDQDVALENQILFVLLTSARTSPDYNTALAAIRQRDEDLKPESLPR